MTKRLTKILALLEKGTRDAQSKAEKRLAAIADELTLEEALDCVAASRRYSREAPWADKAPAIAELLMKRAGPLVAAEQPAALLEAYEELNNGGRAAALTALSSEPTAGRVGLYVDLVEKYGWPESSYPLIAGALNKRMEFGSLLFPRLLSTRIPGNLWPSYRLALDYAEGGALPEACEQVLTQHGLTYVALMEPLQQDDGVAWRWEPSYQHLRKNLALILDLLGHLDRQQARQTLESAAGFADARLVYFALKSMLRLGIEPETQAIDMVAASREMRGFLFLLLEEEGSRYRFPEAFRTQTLLAEWDMVQWLCYPTELAREPDEIELMASGSDEEDEGDLYVFRFRTHPPHWAAERGWIAGWSGPFEPGEISARAGGETFSEFQSWDDFVRG